MVPRIQNTLDEQSFVLLKRLQDIVIEAEGRDYFWRGDRLRYRSVSPPNIASGLQSLHGYGTLPYLYRWGAYGAPVKFQDGALVVDNSFDSGVTGADHPIYGFSLAEFIRELQRLPGVRRMIPANAPLPVTTRVQRDAYTLRKMRA